MRSPFARLQFHNGGWIFFFRTRPLWTTFSIIAPRSSIQLFSFLPFFFFFSFMFFPSHQPLSPLSFLYFLLNTPPLTTQLRVCVPLPRPPKCISARAPYQEATDPPASQLQCWGRGEGGERVRDKIGKEIKGGLTNREIRDACTLLSSFLSSHSPSLFSQAPSSSISMNRFISSVSFFLIVNFDPYSPLT